MGLSQWVASREGHAVGYGQATLLSVHNEAGMKLGELLGEEEAAPPEPGPRTATMLPYISSCSRPSRPPPSVDPQPFLQL